MSTFFLYENPISDNSSSDEPSRRQMGWSRANLSRLGLQIHTELVVKRFVLPFFRLRPCCKSPALCRPYGACSFSAPTQCLRPGLTYSAPYGAGFIPDTAIQKIGTHHVLANC